MDDGRWWAVSAIGGLGLLGALIRPPVPAPLIGGDMSLRLELFVRDLDSSVRFYTRTLGFSVERRESDYVVLVNGSCVLGIGRMADLSGSHPLRASSKERRGLGVELVLEVDDVVGYLARVQGLGIPVETGLRRRSWGATDFRILDPDGYYLRITSRTGV